MDKELIDRAWFCLPREFREEVKKMFEEDKKHPEIRTTCGITTAYHNDMGQRLIDLFGIHNLTSDADGEDEMLYVSRKRVQEMFVEAKKAIPSCEHDRGFRNAELTILRNLFGSKCLPDDRDNLSPEPKPAEPKFKMGDKIRIVKDGVFYGRIGEVTDIDIAGHLVYYKIDRSYEWLKESDLEPYTEPEEESLQMKPIESKVSVYLATKEEEEEFRLLLHENGFTWNSGISLKGCSFWVNRTEESKILYVHPDMTVTHWGDKTPDTLTFSEFKKRYFKCNDHIVQDHEMVDSIIKHGFKNHNRLHIAAMIAAGWIAHDGPKNMDPDIMAADSLTIADALIAESEKGGDNGKV